MSSRNLTEYIGEHANTRTFATQECIRNRIARDATNDPSLDRGERGAKYLRELLDRPDIDEDWKCFMRKKFQELDAGSCSARSCCAAMYMWPLEEYPPWVLSHLSDEEKPTCRAF